MSITKEEQGILDSIIVRSDNDPNNPEFPPHNPKFPATPTYQIEIPGFSNVWLKDESYNHTGTHKDRMAWEIVVTYRSFLTAKAQNQIDRLPYMSIITSGSAGFAVQTILRKFNLPHLKCLVDSHLDLYIKQNLEQIGCEIFETDLSKKVLSWKEILNMTNNQGGIDITSSDDLDPHTRFYDWLSYEVINNSPEYCFIPFGTGHLYENILNINKQEVSTNSHDRRFSGNVDVLKKCHFIGATTNSPDSKATKLYAPHLPFVHFNEQWIHTYQTAGYCGNKSNVYIFQEQYLDQAIQIAREQNIDAEPSALAGLAMLLQMKDDIPKDARILIVSTGKTKWKYDES